MRASASIPLSLRVPYQPAEADPRWMKLKSYRSALGAFRHSRASGNPVFADHTPPPWVPACAAMTRQLTAALFCVRRQSQEAISITLCAHNWMGIAAPAPIGAIIERQTSLNAYGNADGCKGIFNRRCTRIRSRERGRYWRTSRRRYGPYPRASACICGSNSLLADVLPLSAFPVGLGSGRPMPPRQRCQRPWDLTLRSLRSSQ
jgi:hypothetical protein